MTAAETADCSAEVGDPSAGGGRGLDREISRYAARPALFIPYY